MAAAAGGRGRAGRAADRGERSIRLPPGRALLPAGRATPGLGLSRSTAAHPGAGPAGQHGRTGFADRAARAVRTAGGRRGDLHRAHRAGVRWWSRRTASRRLLYVGLGGATADRPSLRHHDDRPVLLGSGVLDRRPPAAGRRSAVVVGPRRGPRPRNTEQEPAGRPADRTAGRRRNRRTPLGAEEPLVRHRGGPGGPDGHPEPVVAERERLAAVDPVKGDRGRRIRIFATPLALSALPTRADLAYPGAGLGHRARPIIELHCTGSVPLFRLGVRPAVPGFSGRGREPYYLVRLYPVLLAAGAPPWWRGCADAHRQHAGSP